jgi:hypothetical protein
MAVNDRLNAKHLFYIFKFTRNLAKPDREKNCIDQRLRAIVGSIEAFKEG